MQKPILMSKILCKNNRKVTKTQIKEMANSISGKEGLLQRIVLVQSDNEKYEYEVAAGRVRFQALELLGQTELAPDQYDIREGDKDIIAYRENVDRVNMTLFEELQHLDNLRKKFKTIKELAAEMKTTQKAINLRLQLLNLSDTWKKAIKENNIPNFSIPMLKIIADFTTELQDRIYEESFIESIKGLKELKKNVEEYVTNLDSAEWLDDDNLDEFMIQDSLCVVDEKNNVVKCSGCKFNSFNEEFLFDEISKKGVCKNPPCFFSKRNANNLKKLKEFFVEENMIDGHYLVFQSYVDEDERSQIQDLLIQYVELGKLVLINQFSCETNPEDVTLEDNEKLCKAICIGDMSDIGKIKYCPEQWALSMIRHSDLDSDELDADKKEVELESSILIKSLESRKKLHQKKIDRFVISELIKALDYTAGEDFPLRRPNIFELITLVNILGPSSASYIGYANHNEKFTKKFNLDEESKDLRKLNQLDYFGFTKDMLSEEAQIELLWENLCNEMVSDLKRGQKGSFDPHINEAKEIAKLIEWDIDLFYETAHIENPEPKSWNALKTKIEKYLVCEDIVENGLQFDFNGNIIFDAKLLDLFGVKPKTLKLESIPIARENGENPRIFVKVGEENTMKVVKKICKFMAVGQEFEKQTIDIGNYLNVAVDPDLTKLTFMELIDTLENEEETFSDSE